MEEDNHGNLWLGTKSRIGKIDYHRGGKKEYRTFTVADGLADNFFNQTHLLSQWNFLFRM